MNKIHNITLIPGDGIGPEITEATKRVVAESGVSIVWDEVQAGADVMDKYGTPLPQHVLESIKTNKVALKGPITTPVGFGFRSVNVALRQSLDLYVCLRPCKLYPGIKSRCEKVDLVIVRENTEDLYAGIEYEKGKPETLELLSKLKADGHIIKEDSGISIKPISESGSRRILDWGFKYALKNNRKSLVAVHKANIMKFTDGMYLAVAREVAEKYPQIEFKDLIVDNMSMQLVTCPEKYEVLVLPNLYGDILSDLCSGLIGGLGVAPGANIGDEYALFEPTHGSDPRNKGKYIDNPIAQMLSAVMMLRHIDENEAADRIENAISDVLEEGTSLTWDLLPEEKRNQAVGTLEIAEAIVRKMK
jgi:isocitrate dehydrogenase (NAD+)